MLVAENPFNYSFYLQEADISKPRGDFLILVASVILVQEFSFCRTVCDTRDSQACSHRVDKWFSQDRGERHHTWKSISLSVSMASTQTRKAYLVMQCISQCRMLDLI